ncbi:cytochrome c oxidase assembly factor 8-like [Eucyclogobius newberryi]|uniref:cytochrome c oxidase assembly factor 8 n=1 Tax=Eucyclogobius newberryi TaxID=166745 RepID=UPI003B5CC4D6
MPAAAVALLLRASARRAPGLTSANSRFCSSATGRSTDAKKKKPQTSIQRPAPSPTHDWIGPPNLLSNLRPIVYRALEMETELEKRLRALRQDTEDWNHDFWAKQNVTFTKDKEAFLVSQLRAKGLSRRDAEGRKRSLDSEEMAVFYKSFLDTNRIRHATYNKEWYRRNFSITLLMARVAFQNLRRSFSQNRRRKSGSATT